MLEPIEKQLALTIDNADFLPSHLNPCWKSPYRRDPQWSQNVGLE